MGRQQAIEKRVSGYIQSGFTFVVIPIDEKEQRLRLEARLISTISLCDACQPSKDWLGLFWPKNKIRESGLWLEQQLYKEPLSRDEFEALESLCP